jgi:hypothetical protein
MNSYAFLFWGDLIVWTGLTIYIVVLVRKTASLGKRLASIEERERRKTPAVT